MTTIDNTWVHSWKMYLARHTPGNVREINRMLECYQFWVKEALLGSVSDDQRIVSAMVANKLKELGCLDE